MSAASRRAQVRSLLSARSGILVDRAESYLAAVDVWAGQGNAKVVQRIGTGLVAVCCWLAAESLDSTTFTRAAAERASGLTPIQFRNAERDLRAAVSSVGHSVPALQSSAALQPLTPSRRSAASSVHGTPSQRSAGADSPVPSRTTPSKRRRLDDVTSFDPADRSPEALRAKAQAAQSGTLFAKPPGHDPLPSPHAISALSTPRTTRFRDHLAGAQPLAHTPSRSSPLKRQRFDESPASAADPRAAAAEASFEAAMAAVAGAARTPSAVGPDCAATGIDARGNAGAGGEAGDKAVYGMDLADPLFDQPSAGHSRARRLQAMRKQVLGLGSSGRSHGGSRILTTRPTQTELQIRLESLRHRLAPLLDGQDGTAASSSDDPASAGDRWDAYGSAADLFICIPIVNPSS
ncbi:uncharacterized protein PFL1_03295 [Pseudozyma flocculosa PF-1]|uniref:Uncharacterized protein n=2 Tax=Pseudozyma flocculosa TaxID=84751 RepID=A0A5C3F6C4_9BASI|nr:uncharacterized protein PFL1_03295 [Pseudozyma flocculosa PF-1]EPQ29005.1 hypothetical protein PFL1_03295 [Pseudozyma flocculosa PF-1]SPO39998.1 uncharacterized protein PSFLO_05480 [Pseudozyma flocculosa]